MEKIKENVNFIFIIASILLLFLGKLILNITNMSLVSYSHILYFLCFVGLIIIIINYLISKIKFNISYIFIILLIILGIIATNNAIYKQVSLYGQDWRCEGLLSLVSYYVLFIISTFINNKHSKTIINCILTIGIIQIFIGLLQITHFIKSPFDGTPYAKGLDGNSNFFGTQNVLCFGLASGLLLNNRNKKNIFFTITFLFGIILTGSMAAISGLFTIIIIETIYIIKNKLITIKKLIKTSIIILIASICLFLSLNFIFKNKLINDTKELISDTYNILVKRNTENKYGTFRIYIWKYSLKIMPKYMLKGAGIDCLIYVFPQEKNIELIDPLIVDKAHNELLQMAITEGIFTPIIYVSLVIYTLTKKNKNSTIHLKASILGYFIQSMFNISVITVAPLYYIVLGLCNTQGEKL